MAKSRSKSPAARKAAAGGFDLNDANIQLGIAVAAVVGLTFATQNGVDLGDFDNFFQDNNTGFHAAWPYGTLLTLHVLNTASNSGGGFWVGDFINAVIACFGGVIAGNVFNGNSGIPSEATFTLVFICWYLTNHNLPLVDFDLWGTISGFGGAAMGSVMNLASNLFTTGLVIAAAGNAGGDAGVFGFSIFGAMTAGVIAGCAGDFFPLNKGINVSSSDNFERTALIAFFIATDGFATLPFVGTHVASILGNVTGHVGGNAGFVRLLTVIYHFFGDFIPVNPLAGVYDAFYKVTGLSRGEW
jgi:hypothetical protein